MFCNDCQTWLSGGEVIHNQRGVREVVKEPTETEEGEVIITCTVCGEQGLYALEKLPRQEQPDDPQPDSGDSSGFSRFTEGVRNAMRGVIQFFLRLIRWLGGKK